MRSGFGIAALLILAAVLPTGKLCAQEIDYDSLLTRRIEVENPTYMPVIGFGAGTTHFFGDVKNSFPTPMTGKYGLRVNVSSPPFDKKRTFLVNFFLTLGEVTGNERSVTNLERNLNFKSDLTVFGVNLEYNFGHFFKNENRIISPFLSVGFAPFLFSPKGDLSRGGVPYHYWSDGTIRNLAEDAGNVLDNEVLSRDWIYETDLRDADLYGLGNYSQFSFLLPFDAGLDFNVTDRMKMRLGTTFFMTFTDNIDNVSREGTGITGNAGNDNFALTYVSLHLDLFSEPDVITEELLFAELDDFDYTMLEDEDDDGILDAVDECLGTPYGVEVDTSGCPLDGDLDGVPDYLDNEKDSPHGAFVDEEGVSLNEDDLIALLGPREAVPRSEVDLYFSPGEARPRMTLDEMPEKFHVLDTDGNHYLDFDELLLAIDDFFDFKSFMETDEVYDVINFFFAQ